MLKNKLEHKIDFFFMCPCFDFRDYTGIRISSKESVTKEMKPNLGDLKKENITGAEDTDRQALLFICKSNL